MDSDLGPWQLPFPPPRRRFFLVAVGTPRCRFFLVAVGTPRRRFFLAAVGTPQCRFFPVAVGTPRRRFFPPTVGLSRHPTPLRRPGTAHRRRGSRTHMSKFIRMDPVRSDRGSGQIRPWAFRDPAMERGLLTGWRFLVGRRRSDIRSRIRDSKFKVISPATRPPSPTSKCVTSLRPRAQRNRPAGSSQSSTRRMSRLESPPLARAAAACRHR
jgi:hypothetical protein